MSVPTSSFPPLTPLEKGILILAGGPPAVIGGMIGATVLVTEAVAAKILVGIAAGAAIAWAVLSIRAVNELRSEVLLLSLIVGAPIAGAIVAGATEVGVGTAALAGITATAGAVVGSVAGILLGLQVIAIGAQVMHSVKKIILQK